MSKAFVKEEAGEEDDEAAAGAAPLPRGTRNYMTRRGYGLLKAELEQLVKAERPALVQTVAWAAKNGDYLYGKKRLREIDRRIRFLIKRLETAVLVDPASQENTEQVFFGATVTVCDAQGKEYTYQIVGIDEADAGQGMISWISPLARALLKAREGDAVRFPVPDGWRELEIVAIRYR